MTRTAWIWLSLSLFVFPITRTVRADSLISEAPSWEYDGNARAAYNPLNGEFLVVWNVFNINATTIQGFFGPVRGQRIAENGQKQGAPFDIIPAGGVLADVVYNPKSKEYFVVAEQYFNTVGQRLDATGKPAFGAGLTVLMKNARFPRVAYNSLQNSYLVVGGWLDTTSSATQCTLKVYTSQVGADGNPIGSASNFATATQSCNAVDKFALAYADLEAPDKVHPWFKTPGGRYLLAVGDGPLRLHMLDSSGKLLPTYWHDTCQFNPGYPCYFEYDLPTGFWWGNSASQMYDIDVAYGKGEFALVWSDIGYHVYDGYKWTGVKMGWVDANRTLYFESDPDRTMSRTQGPVSWIWEHWSNQPQDWRARVAFNAAVNQFVVAWRETPTTNPQNDTTVNHARFNVGDMNRNFQLSPPHANTVVSQSIATANPIVPFLASSTVSQTVLVGWSDFRSGFARTFATLVDAGTRKTVDPY